MMIRIATCILTLLIVGSHAHGQEIVVADFESDSYGEWKVEGDAFGTGPTDGHKLQVTGYRGGRLVNSFGSGDAATGAITSPPFEINRRYLAFLIGGGRHAEETGVELLVDGKSVRSATGADSGELRWESWDVGTLQGEQATLRIFDRAKGDWGHINVDQILLTDQPRIGTGLWRLDEYRRAEEYYQEPFRPAYHFTPELNWMNDPNGLVYFAGEYHLFYQHNPLGNEWGHMSWGHAVSKDLLHWEHLPIALRDEYGVMIFSGCTVVDVHNSSGFGTRENPPLVAIYTGHGQDRQTQDLAFSNDLGRTWTKYAGNPVLDVGEKDFRDPKVFWSEPTKCWVMVVSLAVQKQLQFFSSTDLKTWTLLSEFGSAGTPTKLNWECPDMFELPIENEPGKTRWVLEADMGNGSIAGGSGGEYFTGFFDGNQFVADSTTSQWVDFGRDFYAPVSWSDIPASDGRRIWIGWMNNWETCLNPTYPWRSAMSIPRELTLRRIDGTLRLCQKPVSELQTLRDKTLEIKDRSLTSESMSVDVRGQQLEIILEVQPDSATEFGVRVLKGNEEQTIVGYDTKSRSMFVDRTKSGNVAFHPAFSGRHAGPLEPNDQGNIRLQIFVDACSVEVFGNSGETVITDLVFPDPSSKGVEVFAAGGTCRIVSCQIHTIKSVWPAQPSPQP
jgi:fructan beta-fructosidase